MLMIKKITLVSALILAGMTLSGCTTCDLSLWLGDDLCTIGAL